MVRVSSAGQCMVRHAQCEIVGIPNISGFCFAPRAFATSFVRDIAAVGVYGENLGDGEIL